MSDDIKPDINKTKVRYGQVNKQYGFQLATTPPEDDGPVWMVNLMSYREKADYADGREADYSGKEADDKYAPIGPLKAGIWPPSRSCTPGTVPR